MSTTRGPGSSERSACAIPQHTHTHTHTALTLTISFHLSQPVLSTGTRLADRYPSKPDVRRLVHITRDSVPDIPTYLPYCQARVASSDPAEGRPAAGARALVSCTQVFPVITMATIQSERSIEANQIWDNEDRRCTSKANRPRLLLVAGVVVIGAALAIGMYVGFTKSTTTSNNNEIVGQAEDPNSLGCFTDERHSRVMPYLYTDEELTPSVSYDSLQ